MPKQIKLTVGPTPTRSFRFDPDLIERLKRYAAAQRPVQSVTWAFEKAAYELLDREEKLVK